MEIIRTAAECSRFRACCFSSAALRIIRYSFFVSRITSGFPGHQSKIGCQFSFSEASKHILICPRLLFPSDRCSGNSSAPKNPQATVSRFGWKSPEIYRHSSQFFAFVWFSDFNHIQYGIAFCTEKSDHVFVIRMDKVIDDLFRFVEKHRGSAFFSTVFPHKDLFDP